jgi:hypothetical protein
MTNKSDKDLNLSEITVLPGDGFLVCRGGIFQKIVNIFQWLRSRDGRVKFPHAGFFVSSEGDTFEARLRIGEYNIKDYIGCDVLFFRHECMNEKTFSKHYNTIKSRSMNKVYPIYRLLFHLLPFTARWAPFDRAVCSEETSFLYFLCEFLHYWKGNTPDDLHDIVCDPWADHWLITYNGKFTYEMYRKLFCNKR